MSDRFPKPDRPKSTEEAFETLDDRLRNWEQIADVIFPERTTSQHTLSGDEIKVRIASLWAVRMLTEDWLKASRDVREAAADNLKAAKEYEIVQRRRDKWMLGATIVIGLSTLVYSIAFVWSVNHPAPPTVYINGALATPVPSASSYPSAPRSLPATKHDRPTLPPSRG